MRKSSTTSTTSSRPAPSSCGSREPNSGRACKGAEAALTEAKARNAEAATNYQRIADLFQRRVVSKAQLDQATANRDAAAARLAAAEAGLTTAREGVGYTEIRAPYGGVVTKRLVEVGETVGPGTPLMTGLRLRDLRVNTTIPQSIVMQVRKLKQAAVYVGDQRIDGHQNHDLSRRPRRHRARFVRASTCPRAPSIWRPACTSKSASSSARRIGYWFRRLPSIERSEVTGVYVIDSTGQVSLRYVRPGHRFGDQLEILAGLVAGERIALDPIARERAHRAGGSRRSDASPSASAAGWRGSFSRTSSRRCWH